MESRGPSPVTLALALITELAMLPLMAAAAPFGALDARYGWTRRGRRAGAWRALVDGPALSIERGADLPRAVVEGVLEPAGPLVRVPIAELDAIAWSVWTIDGPALEWIDGDGAPFDLVDDGARARVELDHLRALSWSLGERRSIEEVPSRWRAQVRRAPDSWELTWIPAGTRVRASGRITRPAIEPSYRAPAAPYALGLDAERTPVLLARLPASR